MKDFSFVFLFGLVVAFGGLMLFRVLKISDKPGPDVPSRKPVPNIQGIFLIFGFFLSIGLFFPDYIYNQQFLGFIIGSLMILVVALIDIFYPIKARIRLLIQIIVSLITIISGNIFISEIMFLDNIIHIPYLVSLFFSVLWFVGFINAVNRFDGINGLASGVSTIGFFTLFALIQFVVFQSYPFMSDQTSVFLTMIKNISLILFLFGLIYTVIEYKPRGVIRDVGTMFYGLALAYLSLMGGAKIGTLLVVLSLVIFDAIWVFVHRIFVMKKNPLKGDYTHLHYRLMALGWNRNEVRFFVRGYSLVMMILMLLQSDNRFSKVVIFVLMAIIFFGVNVYLFWVKKLPSEYKPLSVKH